MRLIELRLKNLNSLKGEWHIDFSDAAFLNEGLFAITGQTGAGKTTILDAICLALYGQTPRLGDITGSTNEIMTQGTGECAAEVIIEIGRKRYQCSWYQHRAYKKAKGNLLPIKHEISAVETGKILEEKKSKTAAYIQDLIGMDFNQFTRSIMLAQGGFAAFLKSDIANRAAILEKITGTDIYAKISLNVHEKKRGEEEVLGKLQYGLDGLTLLDTDEENQLKATLQSHQSAQNEQQQTVHDLSKKIKWLDNVTELNAQLSTYQSDLEQAKQAQQDFIPDAKRLAAANKALEIDSQFSQLIHNRDTVKHWQEEQQTLNYKLPQQQASLEQATTHLKAANACAQTASEALQVTLPKIAQARKLDTDISQQTHTLKDNQQRKQNLALNSQRLRQEIANHKKQAQQNKTQLASIESYLDDACELNDIDSVIANFDSHCRRLKALLQDNAALANDKISDHNQISQYQSNLDKLHQQQEVNKVTNAETRDELPALQKEQAALTQQQSLADMRGEQEQIEHISSQIDQVSFKEQRLNELGGQIKKINSALPIIHDELAILTRIITDKKSAIKEAKEKRQNQQSHLYLLQKVAKLEDYIIELKDGHPCPLCGALAHPYSANHPHVAQETETAHIQHQITEWDTAINDLEQILSKYHITQATKQNQLQQLQEQQSPLHGQIKILCTDISHLLTSFLDNTCSESITAMMAPLEQMVTNMGAFSRKIAAGSADFDITENSFSSISLLNTTLNTTKTQLAKRRVCLKNTLTHYETLSEALSKTRTTIENFEQEQYKLTADINEIKTNIKLNALTIEGIDKKVDANFSELKTLNTAILELLNKYSDGKTELNSTDVTTLHCLQPSLQPFSLQALIDSIDKKIVLNAAAYDAHIDILRQQRNALVHLKKQFKAYKEEQQTLRTTLGSLNTQIEVKQTQLDKEDDELNKLTQSVADKTHALEQLKADRQHIFADKSADAAEKQLRALLEQAKTAQNSAQRHLDNSEHALTQLTNTQQKLADQLTTATSALATQESIFKSALAVSDFVDESDFIAARLAIDERNNLNQHAQNISYTLKQAQSLLAAVKQALKDKQAHPLTSDDRETLVQQQTQAQDEANKRIASIGAISQQLKDNDEKKNSQQAQCEAINAQKDKLQVWQQLHALIGSADGKKYRTFAQGLTFEVMISHANTQLQKMSDRYLLIHDEDSPLELNVIDNYQGGDIRSTKNLSGGEGFIISLALALGLSQMASHNIRVDSLFLDEGFGTLDEESLDIALDTLTGLQQEGKLIGIISHVQALKERIMTQIKVEKLSGGFSQITGQGCYKVAS